MYKVTFLLFFYFGLLLDSNTQVVINEVMINSNTCDNLCNPNTGEWTELYNNSGDTLNIGCYILTDGDWSATIPYGTVLLPYDYFIIGSVNSEGLDISNLDLDLGNCSCTTGDANSFIGSFSNLAEQVVIANGSGIIVDGIDWGGGQYASNPIFVSGANVGCPSASISLSPDDPFISHIASNIVQSQTVNRGCDGSSNFQVGEITPTPGYNNYNLGFLNVTSDLDVVPCSQNVTISVEPSGPIDNTGPYQFFWMGSLQGNMDNTVLVQDTGIFSVHIVDQSQCNYAQDFEIAISPNTWIDTIHNYISIAILQGDSFQFGSESISISGDYIQTFVSSGGCDSIVNLSLHVLPNIDCSIVASNVPLCPGQVSDLTVQLMNVSSVLPLNLQNGLVAYYPFNGNANDESGHSNDGIVNGATLTSDRYNQPNSAYNFSGFGSNDHIKVMNSTSLNFDDVATFSLWFLDEPFSGGMDGNGNFSTWNGRNTLFSKEGDGYGTPPGFFGQILQEFGVKHLAYFSTNGCCNSPDLGGFYNDFSALFPLSLNQWKHAAYVIFPDSFQLYINGDIQTTKQFSNQFEAANGLNLYFGIMGGGSGDPFWYPMNGKLDDIAIYNRALSASEILQLYQGINVEWSNGEMSTSISVSPVSSEIYSCTVNNSLQSCTSDIEIQVLPNPIQISYNVVLDANNDSLWYNGQWITTAGTYTFEFACDSVVTYHVDAIYDFDCQLNVSDTTICQGEVVAANMVVNFLNSPYPPVMPNYTWSSLDSLQSIYTAPPQSGNLTCTVTLGNGQSCQESQIISVSNLGNLNIEIIPMQNITCSAYDSLGFYVHSLQGNAELDYTWMLLGQEIQTSTDTVLWILPNSSNAYYSSFDNSYLTVSASSASVSCLAMDSLLLSIDTPISWDMIVSTISDWNILPGGEVQMEISIDTSIYFGNDYTFNWTVNDQVISNIQDTIFTFTGLQNNDVIACQLVSINSCQDIYSNVHEIFVDEPMTCTIVPTDTIPCGADSAVLKVNLINSGIPINDWYCTRDTISVSNSITSVISAPQDIEFLRLNMEHSFYSDLEINLICPNGQNISVATNTGPYKFLGEPIDDELFNEGIGWDYFWSSTATNGTLADVASTIPALSSLPSDFYSIQGSWDSILGCPINGDWIIEICDVANFDQGFLFDWEIRFDSTNSSVQVEDVLQYSWNNGQTSEATSFLVNVSDIPNCSVVVFGDSCSSNFDLSTLIPESYFADLDLDGFGDPATSILACNFVPGLAVNALDCNDSVGDINPDGIEICENSIDEDCSGTDLSCVIVGCMDAMACNYNVMATAPDSSCIVVGQTCDDGDIWTLNDTINSQCNCVGYLGTFCEVFPIQIVLDSVIHNTCFAASQGEIFTSVSGGAGLYYASWNTNPIQTMPHAFNLSAGEYTLVITDTAGCTAQMVVPIQEPNGSYPIISGPIDVSGGENAQYSVEGCVNCQYVWSVSYGLVISNPSPQILNVLWLDAEYGTVTVTQIDSMGCEVQTQLTVSINAMVVNEIQNSNSFILFPNPSRDGRINLLKSEGLGGMEHIEIFDLLGNSIFKTDVVINTNVLELSVESLSSGVYLLSIGNDRMRFVVGK